MSCAEFIRDQSHELIRPLWEVEQEHIHRAMILARGNIKLAALQLGMKRTTLQARLKKYSEENRVRNVAPVSAE